MEDLDNIEGIGMDREEKPKRKRVKAKPIASSPKPKAPEKNSRIIELYDSGFNVNQIGAMTGTHTQYIKELIKKEDAKL